MLQARGHDVATFTRHSDEIRRMGILGSVRGALATPWNAWAAREIRRVVLGWRPDVVHVHNTFPLLSPALFHGIGARATRVLTLHNYRLFCPAAIPMRDGRPCTECLNGSVMPALRHGCYRGSRLATAPLALSVWIHKALRTWGQHVDAFIVLTDFQREMMVRAGLPADRVWVKPNFVIGHPKATSWAGRGNHVLFVGRLSEEKGISDLVQAWATWGPAAPELRIVGDGALRAILEARVQRERLQNIRLLGQVAPIRARAEIAGSRLIVIPSTCFEGFPMVLAEAFAYGTPAAVSDVGALPKIVGAGPCGVVFPPRDPAALRRCIEDVWSAPTLPRMSDAARREYEAKYCENSNYPALLDIYRRADRARIAST